MAQKDGPSPLILAFDTSVGHISSALVGAGVFQEITEEMARGQAERLMGVLDEVLTKAGRSYDQLDAIGVGIGPGNFTGIRISVAAARGLAMALGIPAIGVSSFEVFLDDAAFGSEHTVLASVRAPREQAYVQAFRFGHPLAPPRVVDLNALPDNLDLPADAQVRGHMAKEIAGAIGVSAGYESVDCDSKQIARIAARKYAMPAFDAKARPAPLYVRAPDAAPPKHDAPVILDE